MSDAPSEEQLTDEVPEATTAPPVEAQGDLEEPGGVGNPVVLCVGVTDATKQRLLDGAAVDLTDDLDQASEAAVVLISTRTDPDWETLVASGTPVLVLCHPGGENRAVVAMEKGATAVIAEGDEAGVARLLEAEPREGPLIEAFSRCGTSDAPAADTSLGPVDFGRRIGEATGNTMPTILLVRVGNYGAAKARAGVETMTSVMRRLEIAFSTLVEDISAQPFRLGDHEFALLGPNLDPDKAADVAERFAAIVSQFAPGSVGLISAAGVAGPDDAQDPTALWDLAQRAADAAPKVGKTVLDARTLSEVMSADMELEAAFRLARHGEEAAGFPPDHGEHTAAIVQRLAQMLDVPEDLRTRIALAARLRRIGRLGGEGEAEQRSRAVTFARVTAGAEVANLLAEACEAGDSRELPARLLDAACSIADSLAQGRSVELDAERVGDDVVEAARRIWGMHMQTVAES